MRNEVGNFQSALLGKIQSALTVRPRTRLSGYLKQAIVQASGWVTTERCFPMTQFDSDAIRRIVADTYNPSLALGIPRTSDALRQSQEDIARLLQSFFARTGFPTDELAKLLSERRAERRRLFAAQEAEAAKSAILMAERFRQGVHNQREAMRLLDGVFQSKVVTLEVPDLVYETRTLEGGPPIFLQSVHIEPFNNFALVDGRITGIGEDGNSVNFLFIWTNDGPGPAVVGVRGALVLNGSAEAIAQPALLAPHFSALVLDAALDVQRWSGWGFDPVTGQTLDFTYFLPRQSTQVNPVATLEARGGNIFGAGDFRRQDFHFQAFNLSAQLFFIPPSASVAFYVKLNIGWQLLPTGDDGTDFVSVNFGYNPVQSRVMCPFVALDVLRPRPGPI